MNFQCISSSILNLLCDPTTHEPLLLQGNRLIAEQSKTEYAIINGIPVLLKESDIVGDNKKYQQFYDKVGRFTGSFFWFFTKLFRMDLISQRKELLAELHVKAGDYVLETSIGAGANIPALDSRAHYFGADISLGMLKACQKYQNIKSYDLHLFQANAEYLPFKDNAFDVVFHVGGINFFNDIPRAIDEMIRVAKRGAQIFICDETQQHVDSFYKKLPFIGKYFKDAKQVVVPKDLVPKNMLNVKSFLAWHDSMYVITFNKP